MNGELRVRFLRDVLRAVEREQGAGAVARLKGRLPERLREHADLATLASSTASDTLSLDDGEEVLLALDAASGDGPGRLLEAATFDLMARTVSQGGMLVVGDLRGTVARMRAPLEWPFVGVKLIFDLVATDTGFSLTLGIPGRPRSARLLRHIATGAIRAAQRYCREADVDAMQLHAGVFGDRANVTAQYHAPRAVAPEDPAPTRRPTMRNLRRTTQPRLAEQVERILSAPPTSPSSPPEPLSIRTERARTNPNSVPPERTPSSFPPARPSSKPPRKD